MITILLERISASKGKLWIEKKNGKDVFKSELQKRGELP